MKNLPHTILTLLCLGCTVLLGLGMPTPTMAAEEEDLGTVYVIPIHGTIEPTILYVIRRGVAEAEKTGADAIIFTMDTPGGRVKEAREIVNLIENISVPTYTFVEEEAFSAGAIIALATKHIYMAPGSVIGDAMPILSMPFSGPQEMPDDLQEKMVSGIAALIRSAAEQGGHDTELAEAMVRRENEYKIGEEVIAVEGELLTLTNREAERPVGPDERPLLSSGTVRDLDELLETIGSPNAEIRQWEVTGAEKLARVIKGLSVLFLGAGVLGIWIEIKTPGFGVPGLLGGISLAIFFWAYNIAGLAGAEEVLMVIVGISLLAIEVFLLPGFGIAGVAGLFFIFWGLLIAMVQHYPGGPFIPAWPQFRFPLYQLSMSMAVTIAIGALLSKVLPKSNFLGRLRLQAATSVAAGYTSAQKDHHDVMGLQGVVITPLRPSGTAIISDQRLDVVTHGDFVEKGASIRVLEVHGSRIVVEPI